MPEPYGLMADLHLHRWSSFSTELPGGMNSRLAGLLDEIERCAKIVKEAGGHVIIMAGDVFHVRGSVAPSVLNPTLDRLAKISSELGVEFEIIPGNHDLEGKDATRLGSAVTALEGEAVAVRNEPHISHDTMTVTVPWFESIDALKAEIERLAGEVKSPEQFDLILHAPIDGVIAGLPPHGLTADWLSATGFKRVFAGHYHNHKEFPGKVFSIGALAHHTWSDIDSRAGFLLVTPDDVGWFKSHLPEFIDLTKLVGLAPEEIQLLVEGNYVRVRVEATKTKEVEAAREELLKLGAKAVLVQAEPKPAASVEGRAGATVSAGASLEVSVADFIKAQKELAHASDVASEALNVLGSVASMS